MYFSPQSIWVAASVFQSEPSLAIFLPGRACGMPYAPDDGFSASTRQPLSRSQSLTRQPNWVLSQPYALIFWRAMSWAEPGVTLIGARSSLRLVCWAAFWRARSAAAFFSAAALAAA